MYMDKSSLIPKFIGGAETIKENETISELKVRPIHTMDYLRIVS